MITRSSNNKDSYDSPQAEVIYLNMSSMLCTSPGAGENEDIGFEDWDLSGAISLF